MRRDEHPNFPSPQVQDVPTWLLEAGMGWQSRLVTVEREEGGPVKLVRYNVEVHVLFFVDYWRHQLKLRTSQTVLCFFLRSFATQLVMFLLYSLMCDLVNLGRWCGGIRYKWERESQKDLVKIWQASRGESRWPDGTTPKRWLIVRGFDELIHGSCSLYFPGGIRIYRSCFNLKVLQLLIQ